MCYKKFINKENIKENNMYDFNIADEKRSYEAKKITWIGFVVNTILTILKILAGILGKSNAMIADGVHSLSDFFTDIVVLVGFKLTEKPADEDHNYGHGKYETFATVIIGVALIMAGFSILQKGIVDVYTVLVKGEMITRPKLIAILAAVISIISKEWLYRYTKGIGEKISSPTVIANGWHHRSDAFSSIGTLFGISFAYLLGDKWTILDPLSAIIVSVFIFKVAVEILSPAINELLEVSLNKNEVEYIRDLLDESEEIQNYHNLRTRRVGPNIAIEAHLLFDKTISLYEAHRFSESLEQKLKLYFGRRSMITFHLEPNVIENDEHDDTTKSQDYSTDISLNRLMN